MKSIDFAQANIELAKNQPEYNMLHAHRNSLQVGSPVVVCFELTDEEIADLVKTKKLWYTQITFNNPFHPMQIVTKNPYE